MPNEMVMRSVYLRPEEDAALRQLAFDIEVTKSDLIRSAISAKLDEWLQSTSVELLLKDVERGKRPSRAERAEAARAEAAQEPPPPAARASGAAERRRKRRKEAAKAAAAAKKAPSPTHASRSSEQERERTREAVPA